MKRVTGLLSSFVAGLEYDNLPEEAILWTKKYILDYYAASFAGIKINSRFNRTVESLMVSPGEEVCDYLMSEGRTSLTAAAYMSAVYSHGADMDDGNRKAMGHVGCHVISAVLALSQALGKSGKEALTAIVAGYEVYNRVAAAAQPGLVRRGFHSTGTAGAIACAAACGRLMNLDERKIYSAMSMAAFQASGLIIIAESGQECKPLNPANAVRTGIFCAMMAEKGIVGPLNPLESEKGWFHAMCDEPDLSMITDGLGETYTVCECYMKPYPSCRHTHCGIEAALNLRKRIPDGEKIKAVNVYIYENAIKIAGRIKELTSDEDAKFSIHYSLATALVKGSFGLEDLTVAGMTDEIRTLIEKINLIPDSSMEQRDKGIRGAKVVIVTEEGKEYADTVLIPKGDAANPFTEKEQRDKLSSCAGGLISEKEQDLLFERIMAFETIDKITSFNLFA